MTIFASNMSYQCLCINLESGNTSSRCLCMNLESGNTSLRCHRSPRRFFRMYIGPGSDGSSAVLGILRSLLGRHNAVTKTRDRLMSWQRKQTTTSLLTHANYPGMSDGRSIWMIDCRKFDDPDCDKSLRTHVGRNPKITKSIMESEGHHELHSRLYDSMSRFLSSETIVIMICKSGRHRSVSNVLLWIR